MKLTVNGQSQDIVPRSDSTELTLEEALETLGYTGPSTASFALAVNLEFVPRGTYARRSLREGDRLEILSPMVGG